MKKTHPDLKNYTNSENQILDVLATKAKNEEESKNYRNMLEHYIYSCLENNNKKHLGFIITTQQQSNVLKYLGTVQPNGKLRLEKYQMIELITRKNDYLELEKIYNSRKQLKDEIKEYNELSIEDDKILLRANHPREPILYSTSPDIKLINFVIGKIIPLNINKKTNQ